MRKLISTCLVLMMLMFALTTYADEVCTLPKDVKFWLFRGPGTLVPVISPELQYITIVTEKTIPDKNDINFGRIMVTFDATGLFYICPVHGRERIKGIAIGVAFKDELINCSK